MASSAYGVAKYVAEGAARFIQRVLNREIGGSTDPNVISLIKEERRAPEFELLKRYVIDRQLRVQVQLGLSIRKLQSGAGNKAARDDLRAHLQRRFGLAGLHVAELVCHGIVTAYLNLLVREEETAADVTAKLEGFLRHAEDFVMFVVAGTPVKQALEKVRVRLLARGPGTVVVFAKGQARRVLDSVIKHLREDAEAYVIEVITSGDQVTAFISMPEVWLGADDTEPPKGLLRAASKGDSS